jgi:uncharacterized protein DUF6815
MNAEPFSVSKSTDRLGRIAILWRGDEVARRAAAPDTSRFKAVFAALADIGVDAEPVVYEDDVIDTVRAQLATLDGVLVWVNPIHEGRNRANLDGLLREVAARGVWVSAHPDVILKMGTKEVLHRTRAMSWGCDTALYRTAEEMRLELPARLAAGPRVIKRNRGNGGQGVWRVELVSRSAEEGSRVCVLEALRGALPEELSLAEFMTRCEDYFAAGGCIVDQPFQPRLPDGMIRCYMGVDKVAGFGHQYIKALIPSPPEGPDSPEAQPGPRIMHGPDAPQFQALRRKMEEEWTPQMMQVLGLDAGSLPIIWDADFLYGPRDAAGEDTYVLCEINVSSCFAIPDEAPAAIARLTLDRLRRTRRE